jgi:hypothetical protein
MDNPETNATLGARHVLVDNNGCSFLDIIGFAELSMMTPLDVALLHRPAPLQLITVEKYLTP